MPKYGLFLICFLSHMSMKYGKIRIWFCLYTIYKKIQIRESPYLGIFHAVLLWCFFCWLWTNSCCARRYFYHFWLMIITNSRKRERKVIRLTDCKLKYLFSIFFVHIYTQGVLTRFWSISKTITWKIKQYLVD